MEDKREMDEERAAAIGETRERRVHIRVGSGAMVPVRVFEGVNAESHPELSEKLRAGTLNEIILPGEETPVQPAVPVVYHDPSRRLLALVLPESLRHEEFRYRRWMLKQLGRQEGQIEPYMRRFETVYKLEQLDSVAAREGAEAELEAHLNDREIKLANQQRYIEEVEETFAQERREYEALIEELEQALEAGAEAADGEEVSTVEERVEALDKREESLVDREAEIEAQWQALVEREEKLEQDRQQLDQVADRVERDSQRVADIRQELEAQRHHLDERARHLQVRELNVEQRELERAQQGASTSPSAPEMAAPTEATQVVTDDQFIEIVEGVNANEQTAETGAGGALRERVEPSRRRTERREESALPEGFDGTLRVGTQGPQLKMVVSEAEVSLFGAGEVAFLFQCQELDGVPVLSATLAVMDDDQQPLAARTVVLDPAKEAHRRWLQAFEARVEVQLEVVTDDNEWVGAYAAEGPWRSNIQWALARWQRWHDGGGDGAAYRAASNALSDDLEAQVGTMKHPFLSNRFVEFDGASEVMLAVSIVGYWSEPPQLDYLVGRRAFPLSVLVGIQKRVVRQALHWGIDPGASLRKLAVEEAIILDEKSLIERLLSNFAEVCVGLRPNDLDPLEEWENWESLIALAAEGGVEPDPDVLELAERSLTRAEEYEAMLEAGVVPVEGDDQSDLVGLAIHEMCDGRVVGDDGWSYFMPAGVDDQMERLRQSDEDVWVEELHGPGRVEAAQLLLKKGREAAIAEVVAAAEEMEAVELASVRRFLEAQEGEWPSAAWAEQWELAGERGRFLVMWALASRASESRVAQMVDRLVEIDDVALQKAYAQALSASEHWEGVLADKVEEQPEVAQRLAEAMEAGAEMEETSGKVVGVEG